MSTHIHVMHRIMGWVAWIALALGLLLGSTAHSQPASISFQSGVPAAPINVGAAYTGEIGSTQVFYYVIARFPGGTTQPSAVAIANNTVGIPNLSASNTVTITWAGVTGATGYDVVRASTNGFPATPCTCAVVLNTTNLSATDTGAALSQFPSAGVPAIQPAMATFSVDNTSYTTPYINVLLVQNSLRLALAPRTWTSGNCVQIGTDGNLADAGASCTGGSANGVTAAGTLTADLPVIGAGAKAVAVGTRSGNTTAYVTTTGTQTNGRCVEIDSNGNHVAAAAGCGASGGGDVTGPASSTADAVVLFNGLTGKIIKDSTVLLPVGSLVGTGQSNTWSTGTQDMSAVTAFILKTAAGFAPTAAGSAGYNSSNGRMVYGNGSATRTVANQGATSVSGECAQYDANGALASIGAACGTVTGSSLTANLPVIGAGGNAVSVGTRSGNTTQYVTTTGTQTSGRCVEIDANGNHIAASGTCASGGGSTSGNYISVNGSDYFGGDFFAVTRPTSAGSFAWTNQGGATLDTSTGAFSFFFPKTSGNSVRMYLQSTPSAPYTYRFAMKSFQIFSNNQRCGVGWRESATDKISGVVFSRGETLKVSRWATQTSVPTDTFSNTAYALNGALYWITLSRSGSTLTYSIGVDAITLFTLVSEAMTGPFTTAPDQIGIICDNDSGGNWDNVLSIFAINIS